jgi:Flp pilus assembly protein TadB
VRDGAAVAALAAATAVWSAMADFTGRRLDGILAGERSADPQISRRSASFVEDGRRRTLVCVAACCVLCWVAAGPILASAGLPAGWVLSWRLGTLEPPSLARERESIQRDLPLAADLLAACSAAGLTVQAALIPIAGAVGGPLARRLESVSRRLALGADPVQEWVRLAGDTQLGALGRALLRAHHSGAPVADILSRLAVDRRRERRSRTQATARAVGVRVAAPLAVCFLPAFMLVGVVPTIIGGFRHLGL